MPNRSMIATIPPVPALDILNAYIDAAADIWAGSVGLSISDDDTAWFAVLTVMDERTKSVGIYSQIALLLFYTDDHPHLLNIATIYDGADDMRMCALVAAKMHTSGLRGCR